MSTHNPDKTHPGSSPSALMPIQSRRFSLYKTISWRIIGSTDTFVIAWLISGTLAKASVVAIAEVLTKPVLYYLHERIWTTIKFGRVSLSSPEENGTAIATGECKTRSLIKAISWRIIATTDTTIIALIVTGHLPSALAIGSIEILTKTVLYYYHERAWLKFLFMKHNTDASRNRAHQASKRTVDPAPTVSAVRPDGGRATAPLSEVR